MRIPCHAVGRREVGSVTVEFAMIFPILLLMFVATTELGQGLTVSRKLNQAAATTADLISEQDSLTDSEMEDIFMGAQMIMEPYGSSRLKILACVIDTKKDNGVGVGKKYGHQKIKWCSAFQDEEIAKDNTPYKEIPKDMVEEEVDTIVVRAQYHFASPFTTALALSSGGYDFERTIFARSRLGDDIERE